MKFSVVALFLLAHGVAGAALKASFLSKARSSSAALRSQSQALNHVIQSFADNLEPGATRDFLKTLRLCAPCQHFERLGEANDGGYVTCTDGLDNGLVGALSFGINGFDGWGMAVADRYKIPLNEYDCTNDKQPVVCKGCEVHFHNECILDADGDAQDKFKTLAEQLEDSGNMNVADRSLLLKIDVEAAEWKIFAEEPVENMRKFREIVVEYHWINKVEDHELYAEAVKKIEDAGFAVAHIHGNNYGGGLQEFGEYKIPNVIEVTYVQKPEKGCAAHIPYHLPLDEANDANSPELGDAVLPTKF